MTLDAATVSAVKSSKKGVEAQLSHRRRLSLNTARKRASLQVVEARKNANVESVRARSEAAQAISQRRESLRTQRIVNPPQRSISSSVKARAIEGGTNKVLSTATPSSNSGLIMTTLFLIVGLAVFYNVVTKADQFAGFTGSVGDFLHKLSSTAPLFQTVATK